RRTGGCAADARPGRPGPVASRQRRQAVGLVLTLVAAFFRQPPESVVLVTFFGETATPVTIAVDAAVEVRGTLADGRTGTARRLQIISGGGGRRDGRRAGG